jgi:cell division septation protein DedD
VTSPYFESADEAATALGIPLLIAASSESAVPRAVSKLSDLAVETMLGGRLYHRLRLADARGGQVLWVCAPHESHEYLPWAIAIAEHAAGFGRSAFLLDAGGHRPLGALIAGHGLTLPEGVRARIETLGFAPAAGWASDLAGVRVVLPVSEDRAGAPPPDPDRWSLVVARPLPEDAMDVPAAVASAVEGIVLVAAIRDHTREELLAVVKALRSLSAPLLGLVALGPVPAPKLTPLERWNRIDPWALADRAVAESPAAPAAATAATVAPATAATTASPSTTAEPSTGAPVAAAPPAATPTTPPPTTAVAEPPKGVEPETAPIALEPIWKPREKKRTGLWILLCVALAAGAAGLGVKNGWWRGTTMPPSPPQTAGQPALAPADTSAGVDSASGPSPSAAAWAAPESSVVIPAPMDSMGMGSFGLSPEPDSLINVFSRSWPDTFVVHVNSFNHPAFAEREVDRLRGLGLSARVVQVELAQRGRWYRVVVGDFPDSASASVEAALLRERQLVSFAQILGEGGRGNPRKSTPQ